MNIEELKEGMYIRTLLGNIYKIQDEEFEIKQSAFTGDILYKKNNEFETITKASYNIIDLIEEGDYVNGYKVLEICTGNFELNNPLNIKALKLEFIKEDINPNIPFFKRYNFITNSEIKSIVTKEQFDSMKYEVDSNE